MKLQVKDVKAASKLIAKQALSEPNSSGLFAGWISENHNLAWVVSPHRLDRRTGALYCKPLSPYAKELYETITLGIPLPIQRKPDLEAVEVGDSDNVISSIYTLHYVERVGRLELGKFYTFEAPDTASAWEHAEQLMEKRKVSKAAHRTAALYLGDNKVQRLEPLKL